MTNNFTLLLDSKSYAGVVGMHSKYIDAILVAIDKRNNTNSYAVNYDSQWEAVKLLLHVWA